MQDKIPPIPYAWGFRVGAVIPFLLAVTYIAIGVWAGNPRPIWFGLAFAVAAFGLFLGSFVTPDRLFAYIVAQVVLVFVMGLLVSVAVLMS